LSVSSLAPTAKLLIVQNKGGGHGELGYQICKEFEALGSKCDITILQDEACKMDKPPFSSYGELGNVNIVKAPLGDRSLGSSSLSDGFTHVIDNWSKKPEDFEFVKSVVGDKLDRYLFVSSAGMYVQGAGLHPHTETDAVKDGNGARNVELAVESSGIPYTFMRPQYIYGPKASKRYLDYYIARAARKLPIPLPLSGEQLVCLSNVGDVCSMIANAVGNDAAKNEIFNCATDKFITYKGLGDMINDMVGNKAEDNKYYFYEPKDFNFEKGSTFPFRRDTFIVGVDKAKTKLGWTSKHSLENDVKDLVATHMNGSGIKEEWGKDQLTPDLEIMASKDASFAFDYSFLDDAKV